MNCLYCGECCKSINPFDDKVCRFLVELSGFYFCFVYENRPKECRNHSYPFRHCPVGIEKLRLNRPTDIAIRIDTGYKLIQQNNLSSLNDYTKKSRTRKPA